jgi:FkbM family methyltransferase
MSKPYYQRVPYRLLRRLQREVKLQVGPRRLAVPTAPVESLAYLYWRPGWKTQLIEALLREQAGVFIDVGANVGTTMLDFLAVAPPAMRYLGFEPNPHCVAFLQGIIERNKLAPCSLSPVGLADSHAVAKLHLLPARPADSAATMLDSLRPQETFETIEIPIRRFDALRESLGVADIALVKIDVEGAELEVLRGMAESLAAEKPPVLCEVLHADAHVDEMVYRARTDELARQIHALDYEIWHIAKTADGRVSALTHCVELPFRRWTPETAEECDYLLVNSARDTGLERLGFPLNR